ncbi:PilW family protein [Spiribacter halobius]|uniref:PilW family protein n=1 Tax=Sediminicurvatus halobius TaxID=2182432 RepID=UPI001304B64E
MSLVELMVAMLIGLVLLAGVVQVYLGSRQSQRTTENLGRMQENARFASDLLSRELRMAGFMPCRKTGNFANVLNGGSGNTLTDFAGGPITGYAEGDDTFPGVSFGSSPGDRVNGTEAFILRGGGDTTYAVNNHQPAASSAAFFLNDLHDLQDGDIVLVCDTEQSSLFQVTNANSANVTVVHNTGGSVSPGNCTKGLGSPVTCTSTGTPYTYGDDAQMVKFEAVGYYIGVSRSGETTSLYERRASISSGGISASSRELVEHIENMQLRYGEDDDDDGSPERYVEAGSVSDWNNVVAVRLGLLAQTPEAVANNNDDREYVVAETQIGPSTTVSHAGDRRLRYAFNTTVRIRNGGFE